MILKWLILAFLTPFLALFTGIASLVPNVSAPPLIYQQYLYLISRFFGSGDEFLSLVTLLISAFFARLTITIFKFIMRVSFKINL